jgi:8-hydroxy-5-deazaflavin:NADPH oxidoreductase
MCTAIIGVGSIGSAVAQHLANGGEQIVLAASSEAKAGELAGRLGERASAASVPDAIRQADAVLFAVWLDPMKQLIEQHSGLLAGKVVIDPANPIIADGKGGFVRTLPDGVSSGSVIAGMLPARTHYVKAFGTLSADALASQANRTPDPVALFYATDDDQAGTVGERLISAAGFAPVKVGGVDQTIRIEVFGDLHQLGGLEGKLLAAREARAAVGASALSPTELS